MTPFTVPNWKTALIKVYEKAETDSEYRALCLSDPVAAVKAVSDIELPSTFKFQFFDAPETMLYTLLLPPVRPAGANTDGVADQLISWAVNCTEPTT